jgi:hypothetical protein
MTVSIIDTALSLVLHGRHQKSIRQKTSRGDNNLITSHKCVSPHRDRGRSCIGHFRDRGIYIQHHRMPPHFSWPAMQEGGADKIGLFFQIPWLMALLFKKQTTCSEGTFSDNCHLTHDHTHTITGKRRCEPTRSFLHFADKHHLITIGYQIPNWRLLEVHHWQVHCSITVFEHRLCRFR